MPLITINAETRLLLAELRRIAEALETHLRLAYGYDKNAVVAKSSEEPEVSYMDDQTSSLQEMKALKRGLEAIRDDRPRGQEEDEQVSYPFLDQLRE